VSMDQQKEFNEQIREFLRLLDECQTEEARIECVAQLIFGVIVGARRAPTTDAESEKSNHEPE
jgi:hypothetical protein